MMDRQRCEGIVTSKRSAGLVPVLSPGQRWRRLATLLGLIVLAGCAQRQGAADHRLDGFYSGVEFGHSSGDGGADGGGM